MAEDKKYYSYSAVRNPKWLNLGHTYLECEVNFDHLDDEWVLFSCVPDGYDVMEHTGEIFQKCVDGEFGEIEEFVLPVVLQEDLDQYVRSARNELLETVVDPVVTNPLRWNALSAEKQQEWIDYRQALLDLPATVTAVANWNDNKLNYDITGVDLPTKPS